jgi:hypothetical protein
VVPISSDLPVQRINSTTIAEVSQHPNGASNGSIHDRRSSMISKRRLSRVSMDPSSRGTLSFHNIDYIVGGRGTNPKSKCCSLPCIKPKPGRQILFDVSGVFTTGMNAIMGKNELIQ